MSNTPRVDEELQRLNDAIRAGEECDDVAEAYAWEFARQLERELAEALAENAALVAEFQRLADEPPTLEEIAADLDKIEMLEKELAERDKLIEQMREALTWALTEARSTHGEQLIKAALRAADGGE